MRVIGKIAGFHGIKGEVKIYPLLDELDDFLDFKQLKINDKEYEIESCRLHKEMFLVKFKDIKDRTEAENKLNGYVEADYEADLAQDEYYIDDIIGMTVFDAEMKQVGQVKDFSDQRQSQLIIKLDKSYQAKQDLIIPYVDEYIIKVSKSENTIVVKLTPDLLELSL